MSEKNIKTVLQESKNREADVTLNSMLESLSKEGLSVEFGHIGQHTTYALIHNEDHSNEIVGYTFIRDLRFYRENLGKLKALQQAMARKEIAESKESN